MGENGCSLMENLNTEELKGRVESTEDRILHAAMKVFSINGYKGATTIEIANKANVNEITIFRKFNSKENLLKSVIKKNNEETLEKLDSILCAEKNVNMGICVKNLGMNLKTFLDDRMDFIVMLMLEGRKRPYLTRLVHSLRMKMVEHLKEYFIEQINECNIRPVDPDLLALSFFSFIFQKSMEEKLFEKSLNDEESFEKYTDILLKGILSLECDN